MFFFHQGCGNCGEKRVSVVTEREEATRRSLQEVFGAGNEPWVQAPLHSQTEIQPQMQSGVQLSTQDFVQETMPMTDMHVAPMPEMPRMETQTSTTGNVG
ncbi:MAG: hypothetical protein FWE16_01875 [Firmicutes bacterium]|nr:hypothetical protein [Bacillota bacterium]